MSRYKLDKDEQAILKVEKINQDRAKNLNESTNALGKEMDSSIQSTEEFLSKAYNKLNISKSNIPLTHSGFVRETAFASEKTWEKLKDEANEKIVGDIDFEDVLTTEEMLNADYELKNIDREFSKKTGLKFKDVAFLSVAIALQCARQYVLDPWIKKQRLTATSKDEAGRKGKADPGWYYVPTDKILTNRVPFDAQQYSDNNSIKGFLKGGDHRLMTLGHDPILGWIFGTANIMTSTVTRNDFKSAHVKCIDDRNKIYSLADTYKIFEACQDRIVNGGNDGKLAFGCAILREGMHLKSDINTKRGLPLPGIGVVSKDLGKKLVSYGIDTASVGTEMSIACIINTIIAMIHRLNIDMPEGEDALYEVRTRKIILYSNLIASTSNVIATAVTKDLKKLDVGGILVSLTRLVTDVKFMSDVKYEFIQDKLDEQFEGISEEIELMYQTRFGNAIL